jgi:hypothetical protein
MEIKMKMENEGRFPVRRRTGIRRVGWLEAEVREWIAERRFGANRDGRRATRCSRLIPYAELARAQLELHEPAADITRTLDEYAALLERSGFHLYEGELYELRARLADRAGRDTEKLAALQRAHDCYTRFGMTAQASRVAALAERSP